MIEREREQADRMDTDRLGAVRCRDDDGLSHDGVGGKYRDLRLIDDRPGEQSAKRTRVRDRHRTSGEFIGPETLCSRSLRDVTNRAGDLLEVEEFGISNDGDDEPLTVNVDRDPEVDVVMNDEFVVAN